MSPDVIHLLPDSVANQIAAGEVIQRPASVVKELVENSIDAGATKVQIIIKDAGRTLIQVIDNGCGMSVTDARMAFERHATSKIQQAQDLFSLHTMGFRGEALPSIAAVSEIEMRTMRQGEMAGTRLHISASRVEDQQTEICTAGTNIMVKRLFFNIPARRKFLKKDATELGHITREFERLALVNSQVEFTMTHNDVMLHQLGPGTLKKRICDLFGKGLDHQIIPVNTETSLVRIHGFVSLPQHAKRRGALQYFFVNGRNMRHPYFHKAVLSCYEDLIPSDMQPTYFINFEVDPETIDVNIHPQKYEIKFENEQPIWQILTAAIRESLGRFNAAAAIDFDTADAPAIPPLNAHGSPVSMPDIDVDYHYNPFKDYPKSAQSGSTHTTTVQPSRLNSNRPQPDWEKLYTSFVSQSPEDFPNTATSVPHSQPVQQQSLIETEEERPAMFQLKGKYIVTPAKSGLMLIDQRRAHIKVLYEKQIETSQQSAMPSQRLIFPDSATLDPTQSVVATSISTLLETMGFDISNLGNNSWAINAVPAILGGTNAADVFVNIINTVIETEEDVERSQWESVALAIARAAAIKYGATLSMPEMDKLISDLFKLATPDYTPDGKPIIKLIDFDDINKLFK